MPLMRWNENILWDNYAATAGETTAPMDIKRIQYLLVYVKVSAATTITLQAYTKSGMQDYDTMTFTGAGYNWWNILSLPADSIRFQTSNAATITIHVMYKT